MSGTRAGGDEPRTCVSLALEWYDLSKSLNLTLEMRGPSSREVVPRNEGCGEAASRVS
jgi:hypothetical protein